MIRSSIRQDFFCVAVVSQVVCAIIGLMMAQAILRAEGTPACTGAPDPSAIKVLLMQPISEASPISPEMQRYIVRFRQQREFIGRGFAVLSETLAEKAAAAGPVLNVSEAEARSAEVLDQLAARAGADWVVSIIVRRVGFEQIEPAGGPALFFCGTVILQIRDARHHVWLANRLFTARVFAVGPPPELLSDGLATTVGQALATVLWPYAVVVPVQTSGLSDYLGDAPGPVVAPRNGVFRGWTASTAGNGENGHSAPPNSP